MATPMPAVAPQTPICLVARTWLNTPYHHNARVLGAGVDCAQLLCAVYERAGLIPHIEPRYPHDWHLHNDGERMLAHVLEYAAEIPLSDIEPGDILLFKFGRAFSHAAIVTGANQMIHAVKRAGAVIMSDIDEAEWMFHRSGKPMERKAFRIKPWRA